MLFLIYLLILALTAIYPASAGGKWGDKGGINGLTGIERSDRFPSPFQHPGHNVPLPSRARNGWQHLIDHLYPGYPTYPRVENNFYFVHLGCFKEIKDYGAPLPIRALPDGWRKETENGEPMTALHCLYLCDTEGWHLAGLYNGNMCGCAENIQARKVLPKECNLPCEGGGNETCGGEYAIDIWGN